MKPPTDIVPTDPERAAAALAAFEGTVVTIITPGGPIEDADGNLVGMEPNTTETAYWPAPIPTDTEEDE